MGIQSVETQPIHLSLKTLEADIYIGGDQHHSLYNKWKLITLIENCTLRDRSTNISFQMIYNILHASNKNSFSLPSMSLEIFKMENFDPTIETAGMSSEKRYHTFAELSGLIIYNYEEDFSNSSFVRYVMHLKIKEIERRGLKLIFNKIQQPIKFMD
ncbi:hypothetical protein FGO68_gene438 [Halteria grandinella]|uniref:Uncharacterized protein n=1 Tax=Halteria grandinella TaxID=5974 RepID=A0A8J8NRB7_HALGN|nr:hypothetical protein FGO68_gene438 [Halteria grandinella]